MIYRNASVALIATSPGKGSPATYTGQTIQISPSRELGAEDTAIKTTRPAFVVRWHGGSPAGLSGIAGVRIQIEGKTFEGALNSAAGGPPWGTTEWVQFLLF
jgi:hypothetical protein